MIWRRLHATFDDPGLVSRAGVVPVMALAQRAGLGSLAGEWVRATRRCGVNAQVKVSCLVAGMIAGADSIDDLDVLQNGALPVLFGGGHGVRLHQDSGAEASGAGSRARWPLCPAESMAVVALIIQIMTCLYGACRVR